MVATADEHLPDRAPMIRKLLVFMIILAITSLMLRAWSKILLSKSRGRNFWWDDWFAFLSLFPIIATIVVIFWWLNVGLGKHMEELSLDELLLSVKYLYAETLLFVFADGLPRFSILFFYARVFTVQTHFRLLLVLMFILQTGLIISVLLVLALQCNPTAKAWDPRIPGVCLNSYNVYFWATLAGVMVDFLLLIAPVPMLWTLKLTFKRKMLLIGMFVCGYMVMVTAIGRLVGFARIAKNFEEDVDWSMVNLVLWAASELSISQLGLSLPNIFQLVKRAQRYGIGALFTRRDFSTVHFTGKTNTNIEKSRHSLDGDRPKGSAGSDTFLTYHATAQHASGDLESQDFKGIHVHKDVKITEMRAYDSS